MKTKRTVLFLSLLAASFSSMAQEEAFASRLGAHKEWNVAYVKELEMDSSLTTNAILIQAYSEEQWDVLLDTLGIVGDDLCSGDFSKNVIFWFSDCDSSERAVFYGQLPASYLGFGNCAERTIAIFFPRNPAEMEMVFSRYLAKELMELHRFAQRCRCTTVKYLTPKK